MMNIHEKFMDLDIEISETLGDKLKVTLISAKSAKEPPSPDLPVNLQNFYKQVTHLQYKWETKEPIDGRIIQGSINILPQKEVLDDWQGVTYLEDTPHYDDIEDFKVVDFFDDLACVGYINTKRKVDYMQYLRIGSMELDPLDLDFDGYIELMFAARGFSYWPKVIIDLRAGEELGPDSETFKTYMPQIFPNFKWEDFVALYEKVRIK